MRWIVRSFLALLAAAVLYGGVALVLSELAEVVLLEWRDGAGESHTTRLWIVDDEASSWLRAGGSDRAWFRRLVDDPAVEILRGERSRSYNAIPVATPDARARINGMMRDKYGLADRMIHGLRDLDASVPVRLEERVPEGG